MARRSLILAGLLAAALVATATVVPMLVSARPAYEIPVHDGADGDSLDGAEGDAWNEAPSVGVPLSSADAAVPAANDTSVEEVRVASARTDERLYVRLSWADATRDTSTNDVREFADAVAVQVPANESERPPIAMGGTDNPVNVWYWNGLNSSQELLAGGPGTTTVMTSGELRTNATHSDDRWRVVFSRPLAGEDANRTAFSATEDVDAAVAVWNGSNMERSGQKATSEWYYLALGPGPKGPPYEAILWTVAGLAIVFTTLVTIEGVRRTRGE
ncbi:ethylbenzene dehydrogenase-related protein [Saliphagus infecundisoli]|uniref:Ethylbenzene dehydrogenase-related protein n=1 Tax=Saliphagus infecundisoli TaxID=1849069 RepID=A0ABD5QL78_9EURY|nr:ethylbenzene dehydrogenase-related protein [Saliphagus infecundisoli]